MFKKITAENFKCFTKQHIPLAPLTVLTGENACGKSSVLQMIALIQQSWTESNLDRGLLINGSELKLGKCEDIYSNNADGNYIAFEIETDKVAGRIEFSTSDRSATLAPLYSAPTCSAAPDWNRISLLQPHSERDSHFNDHAVVQNQNLAQLRAIIQAIHYITADRIGPRETHKVDYSGAYNTVGLRGERAVWFLNKYRKQPVPAKRCHKGQTPVLDKQVEAWMAEIFPGFQFAVTPVPGTDLATLGLANKGNPELIRPQNTGFGLSYTLPIFIACLAAPEGGVVLIENPEAHLHPAGQSKFAAFLADIASTGVQIILETHSDHIINGVRKAVKTAKIDRKSALIHFFKQIETAEQPKVTTLEIDNAGNLSEWPKGFFDQLDDDFEILTDWGE